MRVIFHTQLQFSPLTECRNNVTSIVVKMCWNWSVITCNSLWLYWMRAASSSGLLLWSKMLQDLYIGSCKLENLKTYYLNSWVILFSPESTHFMLKHGLRCVPCKQHHLSSSWNLWRLQPELSIISLKARCTLWTFVMMLGRVTSWTLQFH